MNPKSKTKKVKQDDHLGTTLEDEERANASPQEVGEDSIPAPKWMKHLINLGDIPGQIAFPTYRGTDTVSVIHEQGDIFHTLLADTVRIVRDNPSLASDETIAVLYHFGVIDAHEAERLETERDIIAKHEPNFQETLNEVLDDIEPNSPRASAENAEHAAFRLPGTSCELVTGLNVLVGPAAIGKSRLLANLAAAYCGSRVNHYAEPHINNRGSAQDALRLLVACCALKAWVSGAEELVHVSRLAMSASLSSNLLNSLVSLRIKPPSTPYTLEAFNNMLQDREEVVPEIVHEDFQMSLADFALLKDAFETLKAGKGLIVVDSIKDVLYSSGNLSEGGISMTALSHLTILSSLVARYNLTVVTAINPLDDRQLQRVVSMLAGSIHGILELRTAEQVNYSYRKFVVEQEYYERREELVWLHRPLISSDVTLPHSHADMDSELHIGSSHVNNPLDPFNLGRTL